MSLESNMSIVIDDPCLERLARELAAAEGTPILRPLT